MSDRNTKQADKSSEQRDHLGMTAEDWKAFDAMTDEEIAANVASDPDAARLPSSDRPSKARRLALAKLVRQKLRMSREAFSAAYDIPLDTLNDWERHEAKPTAVEEAYLKLIERQPELAKVPMPVAAK